MGRGREGVGGSCTVGWAKARLRRAHHCYVLVGTLPLCPPYVIVGASGQSAATIASSPSVSAAGPGCRISADLISTMRPLRTAGISLQPGRFLILSGTTFLPHQDARITSGAAVRTTSGEIVRSFAAC